MEQNEIVEFLMEKGWLVETDNLLKLETPITKYQITFEEVEVQSVDYLTCVLESKSKEPALELGDEIEADLLEGLEEGEAEWVVMNRAPIKDIKIINGELSFPV